MVADCNPNMEDVVNWQIVHCTGFAIHKLRPKFRFCNSWVEANNNETRELKKDDTDLFPIQKVYLAQPILLFYLTAGILCTTKLKYLHTWNCKGVTSCKLRCACSISGNFSMYNEYLVGSDNFYYSANHNQCSRVQRGQASS